MVENPNCYSVNTHDGKYDVCSPTGRTVMSCGDPGSASHYASLLNEAYRSGYKAGYHDATAQQRLSGK